LRRETLWREIVGSSAEACGVAEPLRATAPSGQPPRGRGLVITISPPFLANDLVQLHEIRAFAWRD